MFVITSKAQSNMRIILSSYTPLALKRTRRLIQRDNSALTINTRHGKLFTQRKPKPIQPRSEHQEKNWALFTKANQLVAADFANPQKCRYWQQRQQKQSRYKTARGLARAYYIQQLKLRATHFRFNRQQANALAVLYLKLSLHSPAKQATTLSPYNHIQPNQPTWLHYSNICWFRHQLNEVLFIRI